MSWCKLCGFEMSGNLCVQCIENYEETGMDRESAEEAYLATAEDEDDDEEEDNRRESILATVSDLVTDFLYYDRKEDEVLPRGAIEAAIDAGEITVDEIVDHFRQQLLGGT